MSEQSYGYGKRPLWQWILLYAVVAVVVYGLFYYFVLAKNGSYAAPAGTNTPAAQQPAVPAPAY